jgi:hypothetical protein
MPLPAHEGETILDGGDVGYVVDGTPRSIELVLGDAIRTGESRVYLRSYGVPVLVETWRDFVVRSRGDSRWAA